MYAGSLPDELRRCGVAVETIAGSKREDSRAVELARTFFNLD